MEAQERLIAYEKKALAKGYESDGEMQKCNDALAKHTISAGSFFYVYVSARE
jgi:hypothetical protein